MKIKMKKLYVIVSVLITTFVLIPALILYAWYHLTYVAHKKYFIDKKEVSSEFYYKNNQKGFSIIKEYYRNGKAKSENIYLNTLCYQKREFHENGNLYVKHRCKNGKLEGKYKEYYENGNLKYEAFLKNGKMNGVVKWYNSDGVLRHTQEQLNDKKMD